MKSLAALRRLLLVVLLITLAAGIGLFWRGIELDSDLRALAPQYVPTPGLERAVASLSTDFERRLLLVLSGPDAAAVSAAEALVERELARGALPAERVSEDLTGFTELLRQHRFQLLVGTARALAARGDPAQLSALAQRQLYGFGAGASLLGFSHDPFGFAQQFANNMADQLAPTPPADDLAVITIALRLDASGLGLDTAAAMEAAITRLEATLATEYPDVTLLSTGVVRYSARAASAAKTDINRITLGSVVGVVLLLGFMLRSARALWLPLISVSAGLASAFVACQYLLPRMHVITLTFGASLIGVAVDYAVHYAYHGAASAERRPLLRALGLSLITSLLGFGALSLAGLAALRHVALFTAIGLAVSWLTVVAAGDYLIGTRQPRPLAALDRVARACARRLARPAVWLAWALAATVLLLGLLQQLPQRDDPGVLFSADPELTALEARSRALTSHFEPGRYLVASGASVEEVFVALQQLREQLPEDLPPPLGIDSLLPSPAEQRASYQALQPLYAPGGAALDILAEQGVSAEAVEAEARAFAEAARLTLTPQQLLQAMGPGSPPLWISEGGVHYAFLLIGAGTPAAVLEQIAPQVPGVHYIDTARDLGRALAHQRHLATALLLLAMAGVGGILTLRYGPRGALVRLAVPVAAVSATALLLALHDGLNLFHVMGLFLVLGLGADYVIFAGEFDAVGESSLAAIALSGITSVLSFGLLGLSAVPVAQAFGLTLFIGTTLNFLGSCLLTGWLQQR